MIETIPIEIIEAAEKVSNYAKLKGWKSGWTLAGVADRHAYEELSTYDYSDIGDL